MLLCHVGAPHRLIQRLATYGRLTGIDWAVPVTSSPFSVQCPNLRFISALDTNRCDQKFLNIVDQNVSCAKGWYLAALARMSAGQLGTAAVECAAVWPDYGIASHNQRQCWWFVSERYARVENNGLGRRRVAVCRIKTAQHRRAAPSPPL
jgi:hypothetical protein